MNVISIQEELSKVLPVRSRFRESFTKKKNINNRKQSAFSVTIVRTNLFVPLCGKEECLLKIIAKKWLVVSLTVMFMLSSVLICKTEAYAQWGQKKCPGISTCYGCKSFDCQVRKVQKISVTFSYKQCKTIVNRAKKINSFSSYASMIAGVKSGAAGLALSLYGTSVEKNVKCFQKAFHKKKGLKLSYEYVIHKHSYSMNKYRKIKCQYI